MATKPSPETSENIDTVRDLAAKVNDLFNALTKELKHHTTATVRD